MRKGATVWACATFCTVLLTSAATLLSEPRAVPTCGRAFTGFDSRLAVELVGILPADFGAPVGFEITRQGAVVATRNRLYVITSEGAVAIPLERDISGIAVDGSGRVALQSADGVALVGQNGLQPIAPWAKVLEGQIFNSGAGSFVEAVVKDGNTSFGVRLTDNDRILPVAQLTGPLRAAAWDRHGLLAVVGHSLVRWGPPGNSLEQIAVDSGLDDTTGVCALGPNRAVVTTRGAMLLFTDKKVNVIAAIGGHCRTADDATILVFDPHLRRVWKLTRTEGLGDPTKDLEQATRLVQLGVAQGIEFSGTMEFREAVRLIGCRKALEIAEQLQK